MIRLPSPPLRVPPPRTRAQRVAEDIARVLERLVNDRDLALVYWNQYRSREMLTESMDTDFFRWSTAEMLELTPAEIEPVEVFYDALLRFRLWANHTEVMPATLERRLDAAVPQLCELGEAAIAALGGRPEPVAPPAVPPGWKTLHR
jgi:hypothetical protein